MKKILNILKDLFIDSNRWLHLIAGGIIMIFMTAVTVIWNPYNPNALQGITVATISTLITMCAVEYKDRAKDGVFDWKDIFAGMFPAICMDLLVIILMICK